MRTASGLLNLKRALLRKRHSRRGAMLALIALLLPVLLMVVTFSIDIAYMQLLRTELRATTDASARAAAEALSREQSVTAARRAAKEVASRNRVAGEPLRLADDDIIFGRSQITPEGLWDFVPEESPPNAVRVVGRRTGGSPSGPVPLFFGSLLGRDTFEPRQSSVASQLDRDIALVLDRSGSMRQYGRWAGLNNAVAAFIREIERTEQEEQVSLIAYSSEARKYVSLSNSENFGTIRNTLARLSPDGRTNIGDGLLTGSDSLQNDPKTRPLAAKTVVLITDGNHNTGSDPRSAARTLKSRGHVVHTISFGQEANSSLMEEVARTTGGNYYHAPNNQRLTEVFREIALTLPVVLSR